jgi:host factor-I protein
MYARRAKNDKKCVYKVPLTLTTMIMRNEPLNKNGKNMAAERVQNLQDTFLNHVRKQKTPLTIFLVNGVKLQGIVTWFDNFCVLLRRDGHSQLVYKHAISTIMPGGPIQLLDGDQNDNGGTTGN